MVHSLVEIVRKGFNNVRKSVGSVPYFLTDEREADFEYPSITNRAPTNVIKKSKNLIRIAGDIAYLLDDDYYSALLNAATPEEKSGKIIRNGAVIEYAYYIHEEVKNREDIDIRISRLKKLGAKFYPVEKKLKSHFVIGDNMYVGKEDKHKPGEFPKYVTIVDHYATARYFSQAFEKIIKKSMKG